MSALEQLKERLPDAARDIKINLGTVLGDGALSEAQRWGVAYAAAIAARHAPLRDAVRADALAQGKVDAAVLEDARAAAIIMGMNNVYYRSKHMLGGDYERKPARLRMQRLSQWTTSKLDLELYSLAVSAVNGCESCLKSHERVVRDGGMSDDQVNDALRIASVIHAAAVALEAAD